MAKRMTIKQLMFILPLLAIVSVFSLYPIITSFVYTGFDYHTNDPARAGMFLSTSFNAKLFCEDANYISYYLDDELRAAGEGTAEKITGLQGDISAFIAPYKDETQTRSINSNETERLDSFIAEVEAGLNAIYDSEPDAAFYNKDKMPILLNEMRSCLIESNFVGLNNYADLMKDSRFWGTLRITGVFTIVSVSIELVLGMILALIMNKAIRGIGLVRTVSLIPWAIPTAISALIWSYLYDGSNGVIAHIFAAAGLIPSSQSMLLSAGGAMASAILADVWKTTPYMALLLLAGLQIIDKGLYESAAIDGGGPVKTFLRITLPLMKPSILVALLFRMLDAFRVYDLLAILTGGGPGGATETMSIYSYKLVIGQGNYGYGSAVVIAMFVCVAFIAFFFIKVLGAELISNEEE